MVAGCSGRSRGGSARPFECAGPAGFRRRQHAGNAAPLRIDAVDQAEPTFGAARDDGDREPLSIAPGREVKRRLFQILAERSERRRREGKSGGEQTADARDEIARPGDEAMPPPSIDKACGEGVLPRGVERLEALGWSAQVPFERGIELTVNWYRENEWWWEPIRSGEYRAYYERHYGRTISSAGSSASRPGPAGGGEG